MAGAALQGLLRNPLADPGVVGVIAPQPRSAQCSRSTPAHRSAQLPLALPVMGIAGRASASAIVLLMQGLARRGGVLTLVLAGVAVSSLCAALMSLALNLSPNPYAAAEIMFWLDGVGHRPLVWTTLSHWQAPLMALGCDHADAGGFCAFARRPQPRRGRGRRQIWA
jgi:iron complex transport system permease protein